MKKFFNVLGVCLVVTLATAVCSATIITIAVEGVVDSVDDPCSLLVGQITTGDTITGLYSYDTTLPNASSNTNVAYWYQTDQSTKFSINIGTLEFITTNYLFGISNDSYGKDGYGPVSSSSFLVDNLPVNNMAWLLNDSTQTAIANLNIPLDAPNLSDWDFNHLTIEGAIDCDNQYAIEGHITSAIVIPEPMTMGILVLGSLVIMRRRKV